MSFTALEYRLLLILIQNEGRAFSAISCWKISDISGDFVNDNTLTVYIKRLREKNRGRSPRSPIIQTVRGQDTASADQKGGCICFVFAQPEIRLLSAGLLLLILAAGGIAAALAGLSAGMAACCSGAVFSVLFLLYTYRRYQRIDQLSSYLHRLSDGDRQLDIRDNEEGELSILKNEIYKVTVLLAEYNDQLQKEKERLADSLSDISSAQNASDRHDGHGGPAQRARAARRTAARIYRPPPLPTGTAAMAGGVPAENSQNRRRSHPFQKKDGIRPAAGGARLRPLLIPMELKGLLLTAQGPDITAEGDEEWLPEALINLLKNGMEHTPAGGELHISWSGNPLYTEIVLRDNGEGITQEDLPLSSPAFTAAATPAPTVWESAWPWRRKL